MAYIHLFQNEKWWSHSAYSYGYISTEYSHWREGTNQCYQINYSAGVSSGAYYKNGINIYVILDGIAYAIGSGIGTNNSGSWYQEGSGWYSVANKTSGTTSFKVNVYDAKTNALLWSSSTYQLNVDSAYPTVTANPYLVSRSINSLTFNIGGTNIPTDVYWSLNNSSWNHAAAQDVTIYNLTANTGYTIYVQYRNQADHSLTTTATCTGTTLPQATITSPASGFNVNSNSGLTVSCTNNSGCPVRFFLETVDGNGNGTRRYNSGDTWNTSHTFSASQILSMLQYAPNSNSLKVRVGIGTLADWANEAYWSFNDGFIKVVDSNPTFVSTQWSYEDTNSRILDLTGNNQIIVKNYSTIRGVITSANKATAKNYATMSKYRLTIGSASKESDYSSSSTVYVGTLTATSNVFSMYAIDSRTNSTLAQRTVSSSNYKEYFDIAIDTSKTQVTRKDKVGSETVLNVEGKIWNASFGKVSNAIDTFIVEYKLTNQTDEHYKSLTVNKPTISGNTFKLNASIQGDLGADGFTVTSSFNIRVKITDKLSPSTYVMTLGSGKPNIAVHKDGVGINQPYDTSVGGALQVNGQIVGNRGGSWVTGRDRALVKNISHGQQSGMSFNPITSIKTTLGSWELGNLSGEEGLVFSYVKDTDYNAGENKNVRVNINSQIRESWIHAAVTLYDNPSGTNGSVNFTSSDSAANYSYLEIFFKWRDRHSSVTVCSPNGKGVTLLNAITWTTGETTQYENQTCTISGTSITRGARTYFNATSTEFYAGANDSNYFFITKVIGYR